MTKALIVIALIACCAASASAMLRGPFTVSEKDLNGLVGKKAVGNKESVALLSTMIPLIHDTTKWRAGMKAFGNGDKIKIGTALATFRGKRNDPHNKDGERHAVFYNGQDENGLHVVDQWGGSRTVRDRVLSWSGCGNQPHLCGDQYYVIMSQ